MGPIRWRTLVHRGSQLLCVVSLLIVVLLGYRYADAHDAFSPSTTGRELIPILLALLAFLFLGSILAFRPERERRARLWWTSATFSVLCLVGLIAVWYLVETAVRVAPAIGTPVMNQAEVDAYLARTIPSNGADGGGVLH